MRKTPPSPLPKDWLPEPSSSAGRDADRWERRIQEIASAAAPTLARYRSGVRPWWIGAAQNWQVALMPAAAAVALLLAFGPHRPRPMKSAANHPALIIATAGGDPAAIWPVGLADAHPVLTLLALEEGGQ